MPREAVEVHDLGALALGEVLEQKLAEDRQLAGHDERLDRRGLGRAEAQPAPWRLGTQRGDALRRRRIHRHGRVLPSSRARASTASSPRLASLSVPPSSCSWTRRASRISGSRRGTPAGSPPSTSASMADATASASASPRNPPRTFGTPAPATPASR